ncbi:MAG: glycoside hydrolase family 127 protein [Armatimonadetes bacterium]|nr:glycoside hydrolase family 127 protein [Armatimonadota bacterium]
MVTLLSLGLALNLVQTPIHGLSEVPFTDVKIEDAFWAPRQKTNRLISIPHTFEQCEKTGRMRNFDLAAKGAKSGYEGYVFNDSDVYKCLEAAAYALDEQNDPALDRRVDSIIARIAAAQQPDGYLNTYYIINGLDKRFTNLADNHELYCAGHLFEAAAAHYRATGKKNLLNVATKFADLLCATFGDGPGKRMGYPGHPEIEQALFKLWRVTGQQRYFDLSAFFLNNRGIRFFADEKHIPKDRFDGTYWQDDVPLRDHKEIKGHAVRAAYLLSGAADYARYSGDQTLKPMLGKVWRNTAFKRMFVTGGIGPSGSNEGFTVDYDLPTHSAYQETCASVAMAMWNHRMGLLEADATYWDYVERSLYNGFLAGVSLEGTHFYYTNPLASRGGHHRSEWFGCACCPPNVTRTIASIGSYMYAKSSDALYVNLFANGSVSTDLSPGNRISAKVVTTYPWGGTILLVPTAKGRTPGLNVRVPSWATGWQAQMNGKRLQPKVRNGYIELGRAWKNGDKFTITFPMSVQRVSANPNAKDVSGMFALQRGPLLYCLEGVDNPVDFDKIYMPLDAALAPKSEPILGGVTVLQGNARMAPESSWRGKLYQNLQAPKQVPIKAIPYYAWDNRKAGAMAVWLRGAPPVEVPGGPERNARVTLSFTSGNADPSAINDGKEIAGSNKHPGQLCHFWPHKGTSEWVQYTFSEAENVNGVELYWFDDTGFGECRPPAEWHIEVQDGASWKPIASDGYSKDLDRWIKVSFPVVKTKAIRLVMKLQPRWSVGVHEWRVLTQDD